MSTPLSLRRYEGFLPRSVRFFFRKRFHSVSDDETYRQSCSQLGPPLTQGLKLHTNSSYQLHSEKFPRRPGPGFFNSEKFPRPSRSGFFIPRNVLGDRGQDFSFRDFSQAIGVRFYRSENFPRLSGQGFSFREFPQAIRVSGFSIPRKISDLGLGIFIPRISSCDRGPPTHTSRRQFRISCCPSP